MAEFIGADPRSRAAAPSTRAPAPTPVRGVPATAPAVPQGGQSAAAVRQANPGVPQFQDNPFAAVGFVLSQFSAGLQGRPLPQYELEKLAMLRQQQEMEQIRTGIGLIEESRRIVQRTERGSAEREKVLTQLNDTIGQIAPGLSGMLETFDNLPDGDDVLASIGEFAPVLQARCGNDVECIMKWSTDKDFMEGLKQRRDEENRPIAAAKLTQMMQGLAGAPEGVRNQFARDAFGNMVMPFSDLEVLNETLPPELAFSQSELNTLRRNPDILASHGIQTPDLAMRVQELATTEGIKDRFAAGREKRQSDLRRMERRESADYNLQLEAAQQENRMRVEEAKQQAKKVEQSDVDIDAAANSLNRLSNAFQMVGNLGPGGVGALGAIAGDVGGLFGQFFGDTADEAVTSMLTSLSTEGDTSGEIKRFRQEARKIVADSIPDFEAAFGRVSEAERQIAEKASGLLDNFTTKSNVQEALLAAMTTQLLHANHANIDAGRAPLFDASNEKALLKEMKEGAARLGIPEVEMARIIGSVIDSTNQIRSWQR